jgi:predicted phosphodiesterase
MRLFSLLFAILSIAAVSGRSGESSFSFAIIGDRAGEAQPGVYEQVWKEIAPAKPKFVLGVGDTIQGLHDDTAVREWNEVRAKLSPYKRIPLYLAPGNHDIWSPASERLFERFSHHPPHYSFDIDQIHVTVLDTSRDSTLSDAELKFLESDLKAHANQPVKIVLSHRPFWLLPVLFGMSQSPAHQVLVRYGAQYVITGHVHKMVHANLDGITYLCMPSAGGHLRDTKRYEDGWFFGYTLVQATGSRLTFRIQELDPPHGKGRTSSIDDWGVAGLLKRAA